MLSTLYVEDIRADQIIFSKYMRMVEPSAQIEVVRNYQDAISILSASTHFDAVIINFHIKSSERSIFDFLDYLEYHSLLRHIPVFISYLELSMEDKERLKAYPNFSYSFAKPLSLTDLATLQSRIREIKSLAA